MENYSSTDILNIKDKITTSISNIEKSIHWCDKNLKYETKNALNLKFKNSINVLNKINNTIDSKPVIAVFGASQVGKSYLIKNLLSELSTPFYISNGDKKYDFLKDINPPGTGAESTGVVTRFTIDNKVKHKEYPLEIKVLSVKDIFTIILDSFYLDSKKINKILDPTYIENHIVEFEKLASSNQKQHHFTEYDVLEIKEYFNSHLSKHSIVFQSLDDTYFFERIAAIIDRTSPENWISIFEVLWNKNESFTKLAKHLINGLKQISFSSRAYLSFSEVLRENGNEILDVTRINELYDSKTSTRIINEAGNTVEVSVSLLAALIEELIFNIPKELSENKAFLNNSDLLDFPGARSRENLNFEEIKDDVIPRMLLRGKVSYLFNKYSDDFNINNLLFCTNDAQLNVNEIPSLLSNWIERNIGKNPVERAMSIKDSEVPPLFIVYTFFNNQLNFDTTNDIDFENIPGKLNYKWDTRFNTFFENEIVTPTKDWNKNWMTPEKSFTNFYLLRDFKYSNDLYHGFEEHGKEVEINKLRLSYYDHLKDSFLNHSFVKKYFTNPVKSWNDVSDINSNGSSLIIENLSKVSNNASKINRYQNKYTEIITEMDKELSAHLFTDDISVMRDKNMKSVNSIFFSFNTILTNDIYSFNKFISSFSLKPVDVYNYLLENIHVDMGAVNASELDESNILIINYPALKNVNSIEEAISVLKKELWLTSDDEVYSVLEQNNIDTNAFIKSKSSKTKSQHYVDLLFDFWKKSVSDNDYTKFSYFINKGLSKESICFLIDFYFKILAQRDIRIKLENIVNHVTSNIESNRELTEFLAETFSILINNLVFSFDISHIREDELAELNKLNFNFKYFNKTKETSELALKELFESNEITIDVNKIILEKYYKWIEYLRISVLLNSGFTNYDEVSNNTLKGIISEFNAMVN